jgi:tetratricopeptide (TPR) repeat protein
MDLPAIRPSGSGPGRRGLRPWALTVMAISAASLLPATPASAEPPQSPAIRILVVRTEAEARAALAEANAGVPFERLVRQRSIGPERERGGYLGRVDPATLSPAARAAMAKTGRGRISPVFPAENGFAIIQVLTGRQEQEVELRLRREPEARALLQRGTELGQAGDLPGAESLLRQATELDPDLADAYYNLAIVYRREQQVDAAIATMRRVVALNPGDFEAYMRLGAWLFERGQYPESSDAYERAATLRMDSREAWLKLAQSYDAAGRAKAAVGAYRQAMALQGFDDPSLVAALLRTALQAKDGPAAVAAARKLQKFRPDHESFMALGQALLLNGEAEAALQEYQKAVALAPTSATAQAALASAYAEAGRKEAAVQGYLRAIELEPGNPSHYRTLARLYEDMDRLDLAIVALRDGVSAAASAPRALQAELSEALASLYDRAGMTSEAGRERLRMRSLRAP